jgi:lysophospholipase L1-like esterase
MPLGDSITQADSQHDSYRRPLWLKLKSSGFDIDFVGSQTSHHRGPPPNQDFDMDHEGHWGWRADEVLGRVGEWADTELPDIVLLHLGTNDVLQSQSTASTIDEMGQIIDRIRAAKTDVTILLAQLIPVDNPGRNAAIRSLNEDILKLAESKTNEHSPIRVVDQFSGFDPRLDTYDGLHPNPGGEEKMAQTWFSVLQQILTSN